MNTKYFHTKANMRRDRNKIDSLLALDGTWCCERATLDNLLTSHFKKINTSVETTDSYSFLQHIPRCILDEDNAELLLIPSESEIYDTLMSMEAWTSPGPNGFPPGFIRHYGIQLKRILFK